MWVAGSGVVISKKERGGREIMKVWIAAKDEGNEY